MSWRSRIGFLVLFLATHASAAVQYRFVGETLGRLPERVAGTVVVDDKRWRIDFASENPSYAADSILSTGDEKLIALNSSRHTWWQLRGSAAAISSSLFGYHGATASQVRVTRSDVADQAILQLSYRIAFPMGSEQIRGDVMCDARLRTMKFDSTTTLPYPAFGVNTGFPEVDEKVRAAVAASPLIPIEAEVRVSRKLDGGAAVTEVIRRRLSDFTTVTVDPSRFAVPAGYRNQEPQIGAPGSARP